MIVIPAEAGIQSDMGTYKYQAVLFDFDGVLSHGRFFSNLLIERRDVYDWIQSNVFGDKEFVRSWMRGKVTSDDVLREVVTATGIDPETLKASLLESVKSMTIDERLLALASSLRSSGAKTLLVTDNMDVFTDVTVPHHRLNRTFDIIVNSADYGMLKTELNGRLLDIALGRVGISITSSFLIDDSADTTALFRDKGGAAHLYSEYDGLLQALDMSPTPVSQNLSS